MLKSVFVMSPTLVPFRINYPGEVFSRKKSESSDDMTTTPATPTSSAGAKGRPTPSRREQEARRVRPLVPADRKEAKRQAKAKRDDAYRREQEALVTGDERYLPLRDKGKVRRFARDWVDARWSISEFIVPAMLLFLVVMLVATFLQSSPELGSQLVVGATFGFYGLLIVSIVEGVIVWQRLKRRLAQRFPTEDIARGTWFYVYSRMVMARRWRTPKPQVARGEFPSTEAPKRH